MTTEKKKSGRKPINPAEKIVQISVYTKQGIVDLLGGEVKVKELAESYINEVAQDL